jgi:hypothetical protein
MREDGDDVLEFLIFLKDRLNVTGNLVMALHHDLRVEDAACKSRGSTAGYMPSSEI